MLKSTHSGVGSWMVDIVDEADSEEYILPQSPYNTRSAQQARKQDDTKVILPSE